MFDSAKRVFWVTSSCKTGIKNGLFGALSKMGYDSDRRRNCSLERLERKAII
jgi:hypothetical protein